MRSALVEKLTLTTLKVMPIVEAVAVQNVAGRLDHDKNFTPDPHHLSSGTSLLDELHNWAQALKTMRE